MANQTFIAGNIAANWESRLSLDCRFFVVQLPQDTHATSNPIILAEDLLRVTTASLNRIAAAVPEHDVHDAFVVFAEQMLAHPLQQARPGQRGCAMSFGPGLTVETMRFHGV